MTSSIRHELPTSEARNMSISRTYLTSNLRSAARFATVAIALAWAVPGCMDGGRRIERVQTNLIDKSVFDGEWWFTHTVVDIDDDASWAIGQAGAGAPWPGATANFDIASQSGVVGRIRWVIDEQFLYAYRSTEIVHGSSPDARDPEFRGQPLAAYRIIGHFDVRQDFNPVTGEPTNVIVESQDRRWYDRRFVRVDWSQNLVTWGLFGASLEIEQLFGTFRREPVSLGITDEGNCPDPDAPDARCDLPPEWRPQFVRLRDERPCTEETQGACYRFLEEWPAGNEDVVHYMSFVTQELWTPLQCFGATCETSITVTTRDAFLRIPPNHEYAVETLANSEYDRFGIIRTESRTYLRGGTDRSTIGRHCSTDSDCDPACADGTVACELRCDTNPGSLSYQLCVGGLTNELGETDFLTYYRLRHNFYSDSLTDRECIADWQCSGRYESGGAGARGGSVCDPFARRCTIPLRERPIRPVRYTLSPHYPAHLVRSAFEIVAMWNEAFMRANREQREGLPDSRFGESYVTPAPPSGNPIPCQSADPTQYCYCDDDFTATEVDPATRTCAWRTNFFLTPEQRVAMYGETDPYQCWIEGPADLEHPRDFSEYGPEFYGYRFVGPECMLILEVNACDRPVAEGESRPACQQLGDLRYQFFNYVSGAGAGWCGVMQPNQDPVTGEAIISPINMGGLCLENISQQAMNIWPILRGEEPADPLFQGEEIRRYFENLGRVRQPVGLAPGAQPAAVGGGPRPAIPVDLRAHFEEAMAHALQRMRAPDGTLLHGPEGRALIYSDRIAQISRTERGRQLEGRIVSGVAAEQFAALASRPEERQAMRQMGGVGVAPDELVSVRGTSTFTDEAILDRVSPFRDGFFDAMMAERRREQLLHESGTCMLFEDRAYTLLNQYSRYWAEAFRGYDLATARIRWMQAWHRAVMQHELGHGLGLEHNFAATLDRDNYQSPYYRLNMMMPLPQIEDFDLAENGGDQNGVVTDEEANRWLQRFQEVRNERNRLGLGNWTASSTMDYPGDLSDIMGLGPYDHAAVYFNYFNLVEAFNGDPRLRAPDSSADGILQSDRFTRDLWTWYRGGEQCHVDAQCPYAAGSQALAPGQRISQRCVANPRYSAIPIRCEDLADPEAREHCVCSNFDEDFVDFVEGVAYDVDYLIDFDCDADGVGDGPSCMCATGSGAPPCRCDRRRADGSSGRDGMCTTADCDYNGDGDCDDPEDGDGRLEHWPVTYLFCSNPRLNDISWCNAFDAGESFLEVVANMRASWEQQYPFAYFRRFRRPFYSGARSLRWVPDAAKIYQHLFFRYFYEPEFLCSGPLCFEDQYQASIEAMNFFSYLAQLPNVGSYRYDATTDSYQYLGETMGMPGATFSLAPGQGFYTWSAYQEGLLGFFRLERAGTFFDKLIALRALTLRDWGLNFTIDERFFINFYDLFPVEMTELFGGYVLDDPHWFAPRVSIDSGTPTLEYLNWFRGLCRDAGTGFLEPCRGSNPTVFPQTPLGGTSNDVLRVYAAIFALSEFPVFYDSSWEQRLAVFNLGNADGFDIPDTQPDGDATCAYGTQPEDRIEPGHGLCADPEQADYILYRSDRLHAVYVAVKVRPRIDYNLEEEQLGFQLLYGMVRNQERIRQLESAPSRTPAEDQELRQRQRMLERNESFLETLIEVQRIFGITSWL